MADDNYEEYRCTEHAYCTAPEAAREIAELGQ